MSGINKVILIGRLGQDPELRATQGGTHVCNVSIATSESYTKDNQKHEQTEWHRVIIWGKMAETAHKYLKKGHQVYFEGKLQTRKWTDKQNIERYTTEIVASNMQFLTNQNQGSHPPLPDEPPFGFKEYDSYSNDKSIENEDIPF